MAQHVSRSTPHPGQQPLLPFPVIWPDDPDAGVEVEPQSVEVHGDPRLAWRLADFFAQWFLPGVLRAKGRASGTINLYGDAIRYWEAITGDPALAEISDQHGIDFVGLLPEWGYTRAGVHRGGRLRIGRRSESPGLTALSSTTIAEHASRIATLLQAAGPRYHIRKRTAEIIERFPFVPEYRGDFEAKEPWSLAQVRQIATGCLWMDKPALPDWMNRELWWKARLALFYYTGFRAGTVVALCWSHLKEINGQLWLDVPKEVVTKTSKAVKMPLHPQLAELLQQVKTLRSRAVEVESDLLLPAGCGYRYFLDLHVVLQEAAGLPVAQRQSPHAWRRTHLSQMEDLGAKDGAEVARVAADHSDGRTTREHYIGQAVVNQLRLLLPPLFTD